MPLPACGQCQTEVALSRPAAIRVLLRVIAATRGAALRSGQFHEIRQIARKSLIFYGAIDVVRAAKSLIFGR